MALSAALEILDWMERGVLTVLYEHRIEPDTPNRMRHAATTAAAKQAATVLEYIQQLRVARDPDTAAHFALEAMYLYMDGAERFGFQKKEASKKGGATRKQQADNFWQPWKKRFAELQQEGLGPYQARDIIFSEMEAAGCKRSPGRIKANLKTK